MANVSANIGANTQQAESSIGRLLASLRKLRQESSTGVGMKMFASDEVNKLSTALNQAIAAAGALNKLDLSQFDQSLRRSAELLKRKLKGDDPSTKYVDIIYREAERMAEIVRKIGKITRYETKPYVGDAEILDLNRATSNEE